MTPLEFGAEVAIGVCLDDVGLHDAVNEAAARLVEASCISALSCLSAAPAFARSALSWLVSGPSRALTDVGLHLDLTQPWIGAARSWSLHGIIVAAHLHTLPAMLVRDSVRRQLDRFEDVMNSAPDFVDGHQHVHHLPLVRTLLLEELQVRYVGRLPWLRDSTPPRPRASLKAHFIAITGAGALSRLAAQKGFRQNRSLLGIYDFAGSAAQYAARLRRWLRQAQHGDLLMTHAAAHPIAGDAISEARVREFHVLLQALPTELHARDLRLHRMSRLLDCGLAQTSCSRSGIIA